MEKDGTKWCDVFPGTGQCDAVGWCWASYSRISTIAPFQGRRTALFYSQTTTSGPYNIILIFFLSPPVLVLVEVSPSRPLGVCWRRCRCRRTACSSRSSSQLLFKSSMLCRVLYGVIFPPIFSPPLTISTRSSAFF